MGNSRRLGFSSVSRRELLTTGGLLAVVGLVVAGDSRGRVKSAGAEWSIGVPIPRARSEMPATVIDGKIYVVGGFYDGSWADCFDPLTQSWTQLPNLPAAAHHPGVAAIDGVLYVAGGFSPDGHHALGHLWSHAPGTRIWHKLASLPEPKGALGLVGMDGGLFAVGGAREHLGGPASGDLLRYDVLANSWQELRPMPTEREHLAVAANGGKIFAIGGRANGDESTTFGGANEQYDPATDTWTTLARLPVGRSGLAGVAVEHSVVVIGGERGRSLYNNVNRFNIETGEWDTLSHLGTARHGLAAAYVDGTIYAIAGSTSPGDIENVDIVETLTLDSITAPSPGAG